MSKAVLISIHPKWCELIADGKKKIDVRKTRPKVHTPFTCFIYETKGKTEYPTFIDEEGHEIFEGRGKVIGEFVCRLITGLKANNQIQAYYNGTQETCLTETEIVNYAKGKMIYYWHISDLKMYKEPKELNEFGLTKPPQSWCYVEGDYSEEVARDNYEFSMNEFMQNEMARDEGYEYLYGCREDEQQC